MLELTYIRADGGDRLWEVGRGPSISPGGEPDTLTYKIEYSPVAEEHLRTLTARQRPIVLDAIEEQLMHRPGLETRNRKPMRPNPVAPWELRIGNLRVYDVEEAPERLVSIRAVGIKERNRVRIGKEVLEL